MQLAVAWTSWRCKDSAQVVLLDGKARCFSSNNYEDMEENNLGLSYCEPSARGIL